MSMWKEIDGSARMLSRKSRKRSRLMVLIYQQSWHNPYDLDLWVIYQPPFGGLLEVASSVLGRQSKPWRWPWIWLRGNIQCPDGPTSPTLWAAPGLRTNPSTVSVVFSVALFWEVFNLATRCWEWYPNEKTIQKSKYNTTWCKWMMGLCVGMYSLSEPTKVHHKLCDIARDATRKF